MVREGEGNQAATYPKKRAYLHLFKASENAKGGRSTTSEVNEEVQN